MSKKNKKNDYAKKTHLCYDTNRTINHRKNIEELYSNEKIYTFFKQKESWENSKATAIMRNLTTQVHLIKTLDALGKLRNQQINLD